MNAALAIIAITAGFWTLLALAALDERDTFVARLFDAVDRSIFGGPR